MAEFDELFHALDTDRANVVWKWKLLEELKQAGLQPDDPRIHRALGALDAGAVPFEPGQPEWLELDQFRQVVQEPVIGRALQGQLAMASDEFTEFTRGVARIYDELQDERSGEVAQYIPTLRNADPERFGIAVCTGDGQVFQVGDAEAGFSVQSTSKPFSYAMALEQFGAGEVHRWVGQEQSGGTFNDPRLSLDADGRPQNPMINAGAIATLALVAGLSEVQRIATPDDLAGLTAVYYSLTYVGFCVPVALAALSVRWTYAQMFLGGLVIAAVCLAIVASAWRAHLPTGERDAAAGAVDETDGTAPTGANGALAASRMG